MHQSSHAGEGMTYGGTFTSGDVVVERGARFTAAPNKRGRYSAASPLRPDVDDLTHWVRASHAIAAVVVTGAVVVTLEPRKSSLAKRASLPADQSRVLAANLAA